MYHRNVGLQARLEEKARRSWYVASEQEDRGSSDLAHLW